MARQGLIIISKDHKILMKIIAGCNGKKASEAAERIKYLWPMTIEDVYNTAHAMGFGCKKCLIVIEGLNTLYKGKNDQLFDFCTRYETPEFDPRGSRKGSAKYTVEMSV